MPSVRKALNLGLDEENVFTAIEESAKSARVSGAGLEETMVTAQATAKAYGEDVYNLTEILDIFATVTQNSVLEQQDLNTGLSEIINTAAQAGVGLDETAAAMITMSNQGDSMREMTELLSNMFIQISISGTALGDAFTEAAGVDWHTFIDGGGSLIEALAILEDQSAKTGESLAQMIGGESKFYRDQRAALGVLELTKQHTQDLRDNANETANSSGRLAESYEDMAGSTELLLDRTEAAKASFQTYVGEALLPTTTAYNELKIAAYEAGIELLNVHLIKDETYEAVQTAVETTAEAIERERAAYADLAAETTKFDKIFIDLNEKYKPDETFDEQAIYDYATALGVLNAMIAENPDAGVSDILTAIATAVSSGVELVDISQKIWVDAVEGIDIWVDEIALAKEKLEEMIATGELAKTVVTDIYDGDTFEAYVEGDIKAVRLAGVDAPETGKEWEDFYKDALGFDPGRQAQELAQDLLLEGKVELGPEIAESYDRSVREVFVDNQRLSTLLAKEGLAIPMFIDLDDQDAKRQITAAYEEAAVAGRGIFQNAELQAAFLDGTIVSLEEMKEEYERIEAATARAKEEAAGYVSAVIGAGGAFTDLQEARKELARLSEEGGNSEELAEAMKEEASAVEALEESYITMGAAAFAANNTSAASSLDLYVALGLLSEEERKLREEHIALEDAMGEAGAIFADLGVDADIAAAGLEGLVSGLYATVDAAVAAAEANQAFADIADRVGDNELADKLFAAQVREEGDTTTVAAAVDLDTTAYDEKLTRIEEEMHGFDETNYEALIDINIGAYTEKMDLVRPDAEEWDQSTYTAEVSQEGAEDAEDDIFQLKQMAEDYARGSYHAYIYTHYVDDFSEGERYSGSSISGGDIYRSGVYYVGEDGPEKVYLPQGSHVVPNNELTGDRNVTINNVIQGDRTASAEYISDSQIRALRKYGLI